MIYMSQELISTLPRDTEGENALHAKTEPRTELLSTRSLYKWNATFGGKPSFQEINELNCRHMYS